MKHQTPHVAMLPSPGMGHIIPMVEFAKKLISHSQNSLSITLIIPDSGLHPAEQKPFLDSLSIQPCIDIIYLPKPNLDDFAGFNIATIVNTIPRSLPFIDSVLNSLLKTTNLISLVVDLFGSTVFEMAREYKIPPYLFFPSNAITLSFFLHLPELDSSFSGPYKDHPNGGLFHFPGCIALRAEELMDSCSDRDSLAHKWAVHEGSRYKMAEGIIINTFQEMENGPINALQENKNLPPVFPVGPLVRTTDNGEDDRDESNPTMKWLDQQPHGSVLFISFGSLGSLSKSQIHELAFGLEMSEKRFIWVIRGLTTLLPEGFLERTKEKGLVVTSWVPQARILGHESTGGFVTHCGWNSVLESVINGVPMIAWPLESDQKMIAKMLTDELKIAMRVYDVCEEEGLVIGRNEISFCVKKFMEGEEGKAVRNRTKAVMEAAKVAVGDGGASTNSLSELVGLWKNRSTYTI